MHLYPVARLLRQPEDGVRGVEQAANANIIQPTNRYLLQINPGKKCVREGGLEPPRAKRSLGPQPRRLPIPPLSQTGIAVVGGTDPQRRQGYFCSLTTVSGGFVVFFSGGFFFSPSAALAPSVGLFSAALPAASLGASAGLATPTGVFAASVLVGFLVSPELASSFFSAAVCSSFFASPSFFSASPAAFSLFASSLDSLGQS